MGSAAFSVYVAEIGPCSSTRACAGYVLGHPLAAEPYYRQLSMCTHPDKLVATSLRTSSGEFLFKRLKSSDALMLAARVEVAEDAAGGGTAAGCCR